MQSVRAKKEVVFREKERRHDGIVITIFCAFSFFFFFFLLRFFLLQHICRTLVLLYFFQRGLVTSKIITTGIVQVHDLLIRENISN
jgi:hypothetical protein